MGVRLRLRDEQQEQMFMYLMMSTCIYGGLGVQNPTAGSRRKPTHISATIKQDHVTRFTPLLCAWIGRP